MPACRLALGTDRTTCGLANTRVWCPVTAKSLFVPDGNVYTRSVFRAMEVVGGPLRLAEILKVPVSQVWLWAKGEAVPSIEVLTQVFDLIAQGSYPPSAAPPNGLGDRFDDPT